jgi:hypothetical protein
MSSKFLFLRLFAAGVVSLLVVTPDRTTTVNAQAPPVLVIASGLDNPRGLAFGTDGALYVAEAGRGGTSTLCAPDAGTGANRAMGQPARSRESPDRASSNGSSPDCRRLLPWAATSRPDRSISTSGWAAPGS